MRILIMHDRGKNVGLGHFTRCHALAQACHEKDVKVEIGTYNLYKNLKRKYTEYDYVIVDTYRAKSEFYEDVAKQSKLVVFDDYNRITYPEGSLIINPNLSFNYVDYTNLNMSKYKFLGGEDYVLLRKEFWNVPKKKIKRKVKNVMISLGGSEHAKKIIENLVPKIDHKKYTIRVLYPTKRNIFSAQTMLDQMLWADIAISSCGVTMHEFMRVGVSAVGLMLYENQKYNLTAFLYFGNMIDCYNFTKKDNQKMDLDFARCSRKTRNEVYKYCRKRIDGQGALRVVDYLINNKNNT